MAATCRRRRVVRRRRAHSRTSMPSASTARPTAALNPASPTLRIVSSQSLNRVGRALRVPDASPPALSIDQADSEAYAIDEPALILCDLVRRALRLVANNGRFSFWRDCCVLPYLRGSSLGSAVHGAGCPLDAGTELLNGFLEKDVAAASSLTHSAAQSLVAPRSGPSAKR
jgi:hypothetical protein